MRLTDGHGNKSRIIGDEVLRIVQGRRRARHDGIIHVGERLGLLTFGGRRLDEDERLTNLMP